MGRRQPAKKVVFAQGLGCCLKRRWLTAWVSRATISSDDIGPEKQAVTGVVVADYMAIEPGKAVG